MYSLFRPLLFKLDAEVAHSFALNTLHSIPKALFRTPLEKPVHVLGQTFRHPVGLAAGLDKNGAHLDALAKLGFSFIEVGTVTPRPQPGNPKPRLFRLTEQKGLINRMGFNNQGVGQLIKNLQASAYRGILGINIGKNGDTPNSEALKDYVHCLKKVYAFATYITINISSPNTPGLRALQKVEHLESLIRPLKEEQAKLADKQARYVPLLIKISPDESEEATQRMAELLVRLKVDGMIVTNTSNQRPGVSNSPFKDEAGGLSGKPIACLSTKVLSIVKQTVGDDLTLIGVGGISCAATAQKKLDAGASLIQLYTGLIYEGPGLVSNIVNNLK